MSAIRTYLDGHAIWETVDDGAVGRISFSRYGIRNRATVYGTLVKGESDRERDRRIQREYKARQP